MAKEMTSFERVSRMYAHQDADRIPMMAGPWESTLVRWRKEGMPANVSTVNHFGLDHITYLPGIDTSPRLPRQVIEETDTYIIDTDAWGTTKKNWKPVSSTPYEIDHVVQGPDSWAKVKPHMVPTEDRINWPALDKAYKQARAQNAWVGIAPWFGYDIVNARMIGTETLLLAMADQPEWVKDVLDTLCDLALALVERVWEAGYHFDELMWFDDMGYKNGLLFSKRMWRRMVQDYQERTINWAHEHGCKAQLHSCGNIMALVPDLVEMGLDGLNPMEIKAGMQPLAIKHDHGDRLLLRGGHDAREWDSFERAEASISATLPTLMENGGYVFASDHSIPDSVSLDTYTQIVELVKRIGSY